MAVYADDGNMPAPHLGYGIHFGPNTNINPGMVDDLGMDWVMIYELGMAYSFPGKHILYRIDLRWPGDWRAFKNSVAERVQALAGMPIEAIEIGNEPNLLNEWGHTPNAWEYVQLLRVAYTTAKSVNPGLIIVSAGLAPTLTTGDRSAINDLDYAREMLDNGAGQWFDAFGYHPYGYDQSPEVDPTTAAQPLVFRRTELIRALLEKYGVYKQVWLTEFGWLRDPAEDGVSCSDSNPDFAGFAWLRVSGATQASYLVRAFQYADQHWPWVGPMFIWNLNWQSMKSVSICSHMRWFSLLHTNGAPTLAFQKLQAMEHRYSDYQPRLQFQGDPLTAQISLACLHRVPLGTFTVRNDGYPAVVNLSVQAVNGLQPLFIEVQPDKVHVGSPINVFVDPQGLRDPGLYPVYINIRATLNKQIISHSIQGSVIVSNSSVGC